MWKIILGTVGLICGLPIGWLVACVTFFTLAERHQVNWFHGDDRLSWIIPTFIILGPVVGGSLGLFLGAVIDRARAQRNERRDLSGEEKK
jgi:hypothetical protein